jgi:uncharacterized Zn finger protein (UPF0148 family)
MFLYKDGVLVCSVCGEPVKSLTENKVEDKITTEHETKIIKKPITKK